MNYTGTPVSVGHYLPPPRPADHCHAPPHPDPLPGPLSPPLMPRINNRRVCYFINCCPTCTLLRHSPEMRCESLQIRRFSPSSGGTNRPASGLTVFALDCVNPVNLRRFQPLFAAATACQIGEWRTRARRPSHQMWRQRTALVIPTIEKVADETMPMNFCRSATGALET